MRIGVIADVHWPRDPSTTAAWHNPYDFDALAERIDRARRRFTDDGVDAIVVLGDLTHEGDRESARAACRGLVGGAPVVVVAGNHDCLQRDDQLERSLPAGAAMLDGDGLELGGQRLAGVAIARDSGAGTFGWTGSDLPAEEASISVIASHFPVLSRAERLAEHGLAYPGDLTNRRALRERLRRRSPVLVLSGHIHARESCADGTLLQLSAAALIEAPHEVAIVDVRVHPGGVRAHRRAYRLGPAAPVIDPVLAPEEETWAFARGTWRLQDSNPEDAAPVESGGDRDP